MSDTIAITPTRAGHPATLILPDSYEHAGIGLAPALPQVIRAP